MLVEREKIILVGVFLPNKTEEAFWNSMKELHSLAKTANAEVMDELIQKLERVNQASFIGSGKLDELAALVEMHEADVVIFNSELSATQVRNISAAVEARIIDRTQLILDIFAMCAKSREGKLQVAYAQYKYLLPRLSGQGISLSKLGGGIGSRGPGESKLEMDKRHIREKMHDIKAQLTHVEQHRKRIIERRNTQSVFRFGLIGYTNAGKSTIFNRLTNETTLQENKLFATLDPTTRKVRFSGGFQALLTDTVGFIQDLPTTLIAAFRSTLEETANVDVLIHVVDASNPDYLQHETTVISLLEELEMNHLPTLVIYNKMDHAPATFVPDQPESLLISALDQEAPDTIKQRMIQLIEKNWAFFTIELSEEKGKELAQIKQQAWVTKLEYIESKQSYHIEGYKPRKELNNE
ncbi:GTPase HflX [Listeria monocytogenes]|uniref:GTPase HflX n=3 Tax=Listeria monocytogenes TaxID=1639 RepID=A0A0H3GCA7_LISM4|nr:GTPase HflX [Listeria monocytogenes]AEO06281.1 GTP-binding protein HflX [Listeria monocytogenes 10403S]AHJ03008.1 GTPase [Listeria monocytogenes WSLC1001]ASH41164.1 GTP-binding protein HflX [Listeria monocytogenes serotype 1/2a str. 10-0812]ASH44050.1 GTP-binding protein HflX [Listeria monocytogenes serotype 1/2a str. 10-0813]ASH55712.1 GTP-binding protein HflX [Listeria monocytogenes serotype 1/2a str. 10-4754]ASH58563.1 GTP-binding protein HflX [Listeria monocytogenes serotype 1/2a str. 